MVLETPEQLASLSAAELMALQMKSCGFTDHDAADYLHIASDTFTSRLKSAYNKLGYNSGTSAANEITNKACRAVCVLVAARMIPGPYAGPTPPPFTTIELEVLRLLKFGFSSELIGERLAIDESTVKSRLQTISRKCGTGSRPQIAAIAILHNLI